MAAKPPKEKPGFAALLRMAKGEYGNTYLQAMAENQQDIYKDLLKNFRADVAELKRLGVLPPDIKPRSVTPSAYLSRVRNEFYDVIRGKSASKKINKKAAKNLKSQGYTVRNNRVVLRKTETVRQNEVVPKASPEGMSHKYAVKRLTLNHTSKDVIDEQDLDKKIDGFLNGLSEDEYISFEIYGSMSRTFPVWDREGMRKYLLGHGDSSGKFVGDKPIAVRRTFIGNKSDAHAFNQERAASRTDAQKSKDAARKRKYRARKKEQSATLEAAKAKAKKRK